MHRSSCKPIVLEAWRLSHQRIQASPSNMSNMNSITATRLLHHQLFRGNSTSAATTRVSSRSSRRRISSVTILIKPPTFPRTVASRLHFQATLHLPCRLHWLLVYEARSSTYRDPTQWRPCLSSRVLWIVLEEAGSWDKEVVLQVKVEVTRQAALHHRCIWVRCLRLSPMPVLPDSRKDILPAALASTLHVGHHLAEDQVARYCSSRLALLVHERGCLYLILPATRLVLQACLSRLHISKTVRAAPLVTLPSFRFRRFIVHQALAHHARARTNV